MDHRRKITSSCKGCQERHIGCHASCETYLAWRSEIDKENEERRKKNAAYYEIYAVRLKKHIVKK
jgi:hypothetical protein